MTTHHKCKVPRLEILSLSSIMMQTTRVRNHLIVGQFDMKSVILAAGRREKAMPVQNWRAVHIANS
jgi:hypothetical protein